ncbi:MAG: ribosome-associated translation inhibitor RaiA [Actinobacteria bacterium]|jgi:ribosomal subunit interface protein|nr:ribosome-associated translation inhibitor RaiA [Actinomycetota bacterium]
MTTMNAPVDIVVRGRHLDISQRFRDHVGDKLSRIDKFGVVLSRIDVEVSKETNPRLADRAFEVELTCVGRGPVIRAEATAADKYAALDLALGRLEERLRRAADRRHARYRKGGTVPEPVPVETIVAEEAEAEADDREADVVYEDGPIVVRDKTHETSPMTVADALHALELVGHDFFLFLDVETGLPTVVYKRRGYDYGLLRIHVGAAPASAAS